VSREISINEDEGTGGGITRSATLPAGLKGLGSWSGTLGRGLGLDTSFTVKLTKSKKLDGEKLDETRVEIVEKEKVAEKDEKVEEKEEVVEEKEETMKDFIEVMLIKLMEDALKNVGESKMKKSSTLPHGFKGLAKIHRSGSFGKRIRQSIRKLVPAKKINEEENTEEESKPAEENVEMQDIVEKDETVAEKADEESDEVNDTVSSKNNSFINAFKNIDLDSRKKKIQISLKKLVTRSKKPKKESLQLINSIIDDIIKEIEGETEEEEINDEETVEEKKDDDEEEKPKEAPVEETSESKEEETPTGVLDKSND